MTENTSNNSHRLVNNSDIFTPAGVTVYTVSIRVGPASTSPYATITVGTGWLAVRTVAIFNLSTGAVTWNGQDGSASAVCVSLGAGAGRVCSLTFTTTATPSAAGPNFGMSRNGAEVYIGDGTTYLDANFGMVEGASFPGPYIPTAGAAVTHNADQNVWTPNVNLSDTSGELFAVEAAYLWGASASANHPSGVAARIWEAGSDLVSRAGGINDQRRDSAANLVGVVNPGPTDASGVVNSVSMRWDSSTFTTYVSGIAAASVGNALTPPWTARTTVNIGNNSALIREWCGYVGLIYVPGGITPAERAAIQSLLPASVSFAS
jgi:hypothetical protein